MTLTSPNAEDKVKSHYVGLPGADIPIVDSNLEPSYTLSTKQIITKLTAKNRRRLDCMCLLGRDLFGLGCLTSQQHACVSQGRICSDNCTCYHTETAVADQPFYLTQSQYTDTRPSSPRADPVSPSAWQGSQWSVMFQSLV